MFTFLKTKLTATLLVFFFFSCQKDAGYYDPVCDGECPEFSPMYYQAKTMLNDPAGGVRLLIQVGGNTKTDITDGILVYGSSQVKLQPGDIVFIDGRSNSTSGISVLVTGTTFSGVTQSLYHYQTSQGHLVFSFITAASYRRYDITLADD